MRTISKVLFVLAILSFLVIFALKMQNNMEAQDYYSAKIEEAEQKITALEKQYPHLKNAEGQQDYEMLSNHDEFFVITDDKIEVVLEAEDYIDKINEFVEWCDVNFDTQAPNCYYELKEFVENNKDWIPGLDEYH